MTCGRDWLSWPSGSPICFGGNNTGAVSLLGQGHDRIRHYEVESPHGLDIPGLLTWSEHLLAEIDRPGDFPAPPIPRLRIP